MWGSPSIESCEPGTSWTSQPSVTSGSQPSDSEPTWSMSLPAAIQARGRPRTRSEMMLRWISDDPAEIVPAYARQ